MFKSQADLNDRPAGSLGHKEVHAACNGGCDEGLGEKSVAADISEQSPKSKRQRTNPAVELQNGTSTYHDQVQELFNRANQELATSATNGDLGLATDDGAKARRVLEFAASLGKPPEGRPISVAAERPRVAGKQIPAGRAINNDVDWIPAIQEPLLPSGVNINVGSDSDNTRKRPRAESTPTAATVRQIGRAKVGGSSKYRGVTRHSTTGRYESHLWDANAVRPKQNKGGRTRGKQLYMGGYDQEVDAARTWDIAAIKWGLFPLNFNRSDYADQEELIASMSKDELITHLKRNSSGFSRGRSQYRGVTRHHGAKGKAATPQFEARLGRASGGPRYNYLGVFSDEKEAALAYDQAARERHGTKAVVNFPSSDESPGNSLGDETADRLQWGLPTLSLPHDGSFAFDSSIKFAEPSSPAMMPASAPEQQVHVYSPTATYNSADSCSGTPFAGKEALQLITPANGGIPNAVPLLSMELPGSPPPPTFPLSAFPSAFGHMSGPTPDQAWLSAPLQLAQDELPWYDTMLGIDDNDAWNECLQNHHDGGLSI